MSDSIEDIKRKAREALKNTASYEGEENKLSSKGKSPKASDLYRQEYVSAYLDWLEDKIADDTQLKDILIKTMKFLGYQMKKKPTNRQVIDFITSEKKRIAFDDAILKKNKQIP